MSTDEPTSSTSATGSESTANSLAQTSDEPATRKKRRGDTLRSLDRWWTILLLLFCVTGVLGLPVLWVSRAYGPIMKIVLSIVVTLYTALLFWLVYLIIVLAYQSVTESIG